MPAKIKYPVVDGRKECGECGEVKPIEQFNRARRHYTSRCHDCLKAYAARYRERPAVVAKAREYHRAYMAEPENRQRTNAYSRERNKAVGIKAKRNQYRRIWAAREKQKAVDYKGGGCCICGYAKCLAALDFHHLDPTEKEGYTGGALRSHWTFEKNKWEIDKCVLVCVRCHREIHAGMVSL